MSEACPLRAAALPGGRRGFSFTEGSHRGALVAASPAVFACIALPLQKRSTRRPAHVAPRASTPSTDNSVSFQSDLERAPNFRTHLHACSVYPVSGNFPRAIHVFGRAVHHRGQLGHQFEGKACLAIVCVATNIWHSWGSR